MRTLGRPEFQIRLRSRPSFREKLDQFISNHAAKRAQKLRPSGTRNRWKPKRSALRELERLARFRLAVLLALHRAGVTGEEATLLQHAAQVRLEIGQRLGEAVTDGAG